ncbi:MAG: hypothetical protein AB1546_09490 [bacterium]
MKSRTEQLKPTYLLLVLILLLTIGCGKGGNNPVTAYFPQEASINDDVWDGLGARTDGAAAGAIGMSKYNTFFDNFNSFYLDPAKWSDFFVFGGAVTEIRENRLYFRTNTPDTSAMVIPMHYFNINPGEQVQAQVKIANRKSGGESVVQSFSLYDIEGGGISVSIFSGTSVDPSSQPTVYVSSLGNWLYDWCMAYLPKTDGTYKVDYRNGIASVYIDGKKLGQVAAQLDGKKVAFMLNAYAGTNSYFDLYFDDFTSNQQYPGDQNIALLNNKQQRARKAPAALKPGEPYTLQFKATPGLGNGKVFGRMYDAVNFTTLLDFEMTETSVRGIYEYKGIMPSTVPKEIVFSASECPYGYGGAGCFSTPLPSFTKRIVTSDTATKTPQVRTLRRPSDSDLEFLRNIHNWQDEIQKIPQRQLPNQRTLSKTSQRPGAIVTQCMSDSF